MAGFGAAATSRIPAMAASGFFFCHMPERMGASARWTGRSLAWHVQEKTTTRLISSLINDNKRRAAD